MKRLHKNVHTLCTVQDVCSWHVSRKTSDRTAVSFGAFGCQKIINNQGIRMFAGFVSAGGSTNEGGTLFSWRRSQQGRTSFAVLFGPNGMYVHVFVNDPHMSLPPEPARGNNPGRHRFRRKYNIKK